jgi:hypothetical protein
MLQKIGINISGSVGETVTKTFSASGSAKIDSFCKECYAEAGHEYIEKHYVISCGQHPNWEVEGTYTVYKGEYANAYSSPSPSPPCTLCPPEP